MTDPWLQLCVGRPCVACGADDGTIVPAHSNQQAHGKGLSIKADNWTVVPLCMGCHASLDRTYTRDEARAFWRHCWASHMSALLSAGLVAPVGKTTREKAYKPPSKVLPRNVA